MRTDERQKSSRNASVREKPRDRGVEVWRRKAKNPTMTTDSI